MTSGSDTHCLAKGVSKLVDYFKAGAKICGKWSLGFELEQIVIDKNNDTVPFAGEAGITAILKDLSPLYEREIRADKNDPESPLIGLIRKDATVTLEPGAQFEFSSMPFWELSELKSTWNRYQQEVVTATNRYGYIPRTIGYQPRSLVENITLLPKERYNMMNEHFKGTGKHGINMMRGSASTQVTIDYCTEQDALLKMRIAAALTPLFSLLTDNTPNFEGNQVDNYLKRTQIWNDVDPARSMIPPGLFSKDYSFASYAETALTAPIILFDHANEVSYAGNKGAVDCYDMTNLSKTDIEHILSMLFFDVRMRNYIEIRCADSMPFPYALAFVALIKGIFYDDDNLHQIALSFEHFTDETVPAIKEALIRDGYDADVEAYYGKSVQEALLDLIARARSGLQVIAADEAVYLEIFEVLVAQKTTLANITKPH